MSDAVIRLALPEDLPAVARMGAELMRLHHRFDPARFLVAPEGVERGYAAFLEGELEDDDSAIFVANVDGELVGYCFAGVEPHSWKELREAAGFIHDIAVAESARRRGIATALLEHASQWLAAQGVPRVMLWTAERNTTAQRLFARLGFRPTMIEMTREIDRG